MMTKLLMKIVVMASLLATPTWSMPIGPQQEIPDAPSNSIVNVATSSQKAAGRRACRAKYGARLAYVTFSRNRYVCHFRKSTRKLTKEAARSCRKTGLKLVRVNSIKIKGNKSVTRFTCARR